MRPALLCLVLSTCATRPLAYELRCADRTETCLDARTILCERTDEYATYACASLASLDPDSCPDGGP